MRSLKGRPGPAALAALGLACAAHPGAGAEPVPASELSAPHEISNCVTEGHPFMGIRTLGALRLRSTWIDGHRLAELSGLAWDEDEGRLYAISDSGSLFHFRPEFSGGRLTGLEGRAAFALRGAGGARLEGRAADSEGLAIDNGANGIRGDSELIVSFERRPRLARYTPRGRYLDVIPLPAPLGDVDRYASANKSLESVTRHPEHGWLTGAERPMRGGRPGIIRIRGPRGLGWDYPLADVPNNALVALEALADGSVVTLERGHGLLYAPVIISLRRIPPLSRSRAGPLRPVTLAVLDSSKGWRVDNFEGLTRHRERRFFLVSDDNQNALQATLLLYLEVLDTAPGEPGAADCDKHPENAH